jgi:hypothetical protein
MANIEGNMINNFTDQQRAQTTQGASGAPRRQIGTAPTNGMIDS